MHKQIVGWLLHTFSIFGALSNILILVFVQRLIKKHQSITSHYLWTTLLISTDIVSCLMSASFSLHSALPIYNYDIIRELWILMGNLFCISVSVSFWTLTALSYDRYRAITRPFSNKLPLKWIYAVYLVFVIVAFLVKYGSIFLEDEDESLSTIVVSFVICELLFPLTFIVFFYIKIEKVLRFNASLGVPNHVRIKQNKRALIVCKRLMQTFMLCVVPFRSAALLMKCLLKFVYVQPSEARTNLEICMSYPMAFLNLHCCANVFVYGVQMVAFRRFIRQSLTCVSTRDY